MIFFYVFDSSIGQRSSLRLFIHFFCIIIHLLFINAVIGDFTLCSSRLVEQIECFFSRSILADIINQNPIYDNELRIYHHFRILIANSNSTRATMDQKSLILSIIAISLTIVLFSSTTDACSCLPSHPQTSYCNSEYGNATLR